MEDKRTNDSSIEGVVYMDIYNEYINNLKKRVADVKREIKDRKKKQLIDFNTYPVAGLVLELQDIIRNLKDSADLFKAEIVLSPPFVDSDFSIPIFGLIKSLAIGPKIISQQIRELAFSKNNSQIEEVSVSSGFLNIKLKKNSFYHSVLSSVFACGNYYGWSDLYFKKVSIFDYSSPNIAKPIGVGHLRSTVIGQDMSTIYEALGYSVIRINHLGDWGTQFGALIYAYKHWVNEEKFQKNPLEELKNLYVRFNTEAENNPEIKIEAREIFHKLEEKDEVFIAL